jgi:hypothetical protein
MSTVPGSGGRGAAAPSGGAGEEADGGSPAGGSCMESLGWGHPAAAAGGLPAPTRGVLSVRELDYPAPPKKFKRPRSLSLGAFPFAWLVGVGARW